MNKPETLYELCALTAEAIETQPLNYHQGYWCVSAQEAVGAEACGTAYCRAGWMYALLQDEDNMPSLDLLKPNSYDLIAKGMFQLLQNAGIPDDAINQLFAGIGDEECSRTYHPDLHNQDPGTEEYARTGADGMRQFMREFEAQLKATKLP